jgi:chromosome segregation ATPase
MATSDKTIFSNTTGLSSTSGQLQTVINNLQAQKMQVNALITAKESELTTVQGQRASCQRTGLFRTWDNGCLDTNTSAQNALTAEIANLRQRLVDLDAQIVKAQADLKTALANEAATQQAAAQAATQQAAAQTQVLQAQALANPETAAVMLAAQAAMFILKK